MMKVGVVPGIPGKVTRLVQGTIMLRPEQQEAQMPLLDAVHAAGIRAWDSSHIYGGGGSDKVLGAWARSRGVRNDIVVMDKVCHPLEGKHRVTAKHIAQDLRTCLDNLGFDRIDILSFHRDDPRVPVAELVEGMNDQIRAGLIRAYGCSNWSLARFQEAVSYARTKGLVPMAVASPHYSLAVSYDAPWEGCLSITGEEHKAERNHYRDHGVCLFTWSSLSGGFFSGRFERDNLASLTDGQAELVKRCYAREDNFRRLDRVRELARARNRSPSQIALAWVLGGELNTYPLIACWKPEEAVDNAAACDITLSPAELAWLDLRSDTRR